MQLLLRRYSLKFQELATYNYTYLQLKSSYTQVVLFRHSNNIPIDDGQVCFHRWHFANSFKPSRVTTEPDGPHQGALVRQHGVPNCSQCPDTLACAMV